MRTDQLRIEPLGLHPGLVPLTVQWHVAEFDQVGEREFWTRARQVEARLSGIPCAWIAFAGEAPVGTVSLIEHNMDTKMDLRPWLAALFVLPEYRRRGVGTSLVRRCEDEARSVGERRLYLYTLTGEAFYERLGWSVISREQYEGEDTVVMERGL
jgi:predicted N-acetyltransferase YhbS